MTVCQPPTGDRESAFGLRSRGKTASFPCSFTEPQLRAYLFEFRINVEDLGRDTPPALGGNLAGALSPATEAVLLRTFAFGSSLLTGVGVGAATGAVGWLASRLIPATRR